MNSNKKRKEEKEEYYSVIKRKDIPPLVSSWMNLEGIMLSEISQTEKDKYCMISLTCGVLGKKGKKKEKNQTHRKRDQANPIWGGVSESYTNLHPGPIWNYK